MKVEIGGKIGDKTEYFCHNCQQLRLSYIEDKSKCQNCGSTNIVTGKVGELNKQALKTKKG